MVNLAKVTSYDALVSRVSGQLRDAMDVDSLVSACQQSRYDDREFCYEDIIRSCYARVFRSYCGRLYWFSGRVWEPMPDVLLYNSFRTTLVSVAGGAFPLMRSDVRKGLRGILGRLDCCCCDELRVSKYVVGFRNCVVDFSDVYHPVEHSFADKMPVVGLLDYDWDPDATCPLWESFLHQVLRPGQVVLLQKFLGLGCVPRGHRRIERMLWLIGDGANGKSTIQGVVMGVYGRGMVATSKLAHLLCKNPEDQLRQMATIVGRAFNYCDEVGEVNISGNLDAFKSLVSGDEQAYRLLKNDIRKSDEIPYMICNMNHRPDVRNLDKAVVRRLLQINFSASVSEEDMDLELGAKLRGEYSGIRNWMLEGWKMLERDGFHFGDEDSEMEEVDMMMENGLGVDAFLRAFGLRTGCRAGHLEEKPRWLYLRRLFKQYEIWARGRGSEPVSKEAFGLRLSRLRPKHRKSSETLYSLYCDDDVYEMFNKD